MATDLIVLEKLNPITIFSDNGADPLLEAIKKRVAEMPQDISTKEGREAIRSGAYEIARTKTTIDKMRVALVADEKAKLKKIDAEGARIWDELEALQKSYRAPLTAWEKQDEVRIAAHEAALAAIIEHPAYGQNETAAQIAERLSYLESYPARDWQEFSARATKALTDEIDRTKTLLAAAQKREAEQAELERLRREEAERKQREHEARIAAEAAAKAKAEAEEKALREAEAEAARVKAEQERQEQERQRIEREKAEAEERARKAEEARKAAEEKAEADRKAAEEKARQDAIAAEQRAKREAELAAQRERERIDAERKAEAEAAAKRETDKKHRARVNNEALAALLNTGITDEHGKAIIAAIAKGEIPHIEIQY